MSTDADALKVVGAGCFPLVKDFSGFVDRRVTTWQLEDTEFARVQESVDFTLSDAQATALSIPGHGTFVPFGWLRRTPLRGFDLKLGSSSVAMVTAEQTNSIVEGLVSAAVETLPDDVQTAVRSLALRVDALDATAVERTSAFEEFRALREGTAGQDTVEFEAWGDVEWLLEVLTRSFLAIAVLPSKPDVRTVLKYAHDAELRVSADPDGPSHPTGDRSWLATARTYVLEVPTSLLAASHHIDVRLPEDLQAARARLVDGTTGADLRHARRRYSQDRVAFYSRRDQLAQADPRIEIVLVAESRTYATPAQVIVASLLLMLLLGWWAGPRDLPATSTAILLSASGALTALAQRLPETSLSRMLVAVPRVLVVVSGLAVLFAGAVVSLQLPNGVQDAGWGVALLATVVANLTLVIVAADGSRRGDAGILEDRKATLLAMVFAVIVGLAAAAVAFNPLLDVSPAWYLDVVWAAGILVVVSRGHYALRALLRARDDS